MPWHFRRSIRLPGGFRINVSRRGLGYSWGVPGAHFGRDARGRNYQAYSVPGTGIYSRSYSSRGEPTTSEPSSFWKWFGLGMVIGIFSGILRSSRRKKSSGVGCLLLLILLAVPLFLLGEVISFVQAVPISVWVALGLIAIVLVVTQHFQFEVQRASGPSDSAALAAVEVGPPQPDVGIQARGVSAELGSVSPGSAANAELDKFLEDTVTELGAALTLALRDPSNLHFQLDIEDVISRFGNQHGSPSQSAGSLLLKLLKRLHPAEFAGWNIDTALLQLRLTSEVNSRPVNSPAKLPTTLQLLNCASGDRMDDLLRRTREWFLFLATASASSDGKISGEKEAAIFAFKAEMEAGRADSMRGTSGAKPPATVGSLTDSSPPPMPAVNQEYARLHHEIVEAKRSGNFIAAISCARQTFRILPQLVDTWKQQYGQFNIVTSVAVDTGSSLMALSGDREGIAELRRVLTERPELKQWTPIADAAERDLVTVEAILAEVFRQPGCVQQDLKGKLGLEDGRHVAALVSGLEKVGRLRREPEGRTYRLFPITAMGTGEPSSS